MNLHFEMVSEDLRIVLQKLMGFDSLNSFRLVGGTALALQLGHRSSKDLDLFAAGGTPPPEKLAADLSQRLKGDIKIVHVLRYGLTAVINNIKVDLYDWKVPFAFDTLVSDGLRLASIEDIFAFKCEAVLGRKEEKDMADIAEISFHRDFNLLLDTFQKRYTQYNKATVLAVLLKPEAFGRDYTIQYAPGKSWEKYCHQLLQSIKDYEKKLELKKEAEMKNRDKKIQQLIDEKRKKQK